MADLNPFLLAAVTPNPDPRLLPLLRSKPALASAQDDHGYSLLHAAASYNHLDLLRSLISEFHVDINLTDEDGETCLFVAESVDVAKCLVEDLQIDVDIKNDEGLNAMEKFVLEQEFPDVASYLRSSASNSTDDASVNNASATDNAPPPPLPPNVTINVNTADESVSSMPESEPDPEFRRRIEELAASDHFHTDQGQRELRELITDAVRGVNNEERDVRRRMG